MSDAGFCVWVEGGPMKVVAAIARAVATDLAHTHQVEELASGPEMPARLARAVAIPGMVVVLATEVPDDHRRAEVQSLVSALIEVAVGEVPPGDRAPDVAVPADPARAGEAARVVLRHLAAAGWTEPLEDYDDDDEAAVSGRLQNFGYL